ATASLHTLSHTTLFRSETPGDIAVMADDHTGQSRKREPGYVIGTFLVDGAAVQSHLVPHPGHRCGQVRIICQDGFAACRVPSVDDPRIGADPLLAEPQ